MMILVIVIFGIVGCRNSSVNESKKENVPVESWSDGLKEYEASWPNRFDFGRSASKEFIAKWDIDVRPDGRGLPKGNGRPAYGALMYKQKCASCHGKNGYEGPEVKLVDDGSGANIIGNYWPYATTIFDYIRRAMPFDRPGSLTDQEVYDITAYLLSLNQIIDADDEINEQSLPKIEMPARKQYVLDDRKGGKEIK
ncbi:c-type cytochrome [Sphingobacterium corticis]|uniref:C-type cytochrome n=1 Tax=Sphingobacterium corticis TaxID=1812823 RepID=A0ABW5NHZ3_9SPHI